MAPLEAHIKSVWQRRPTCHYKEGEQAVHFVRYRTDLRLNVDEDGLEGSSEYARENKEKYKSYGERAILIQCERHYKDLREQFPEQPWEAGMGEQLLVSGINAETVCVGDVFGCSESQLLLEVTFPRHPCARVDRRYPVSPPRVTGQPGTCRQWIAATGRGGLFCRVKNPGDLAEGDQLKLLRRPCPKWTLARLSAMCYPVSPLRMSWSGTDAELVELCNLEELGYNEWRERLIVVKSALAAERPLQVPEWLGRPMPREEGLEAIAGMWSVGGCAGDMDVQLYIDEGEVRSTEPIGITHLVGRPMEQEKCFTMNVQLGGFPMTASLNQTACKALLLFSSGMVWMKIEGKLDTDAQVLETSVDFPADDNSHL
jgi:MOSC domain-containing protein YiiM